MKSLPVYGLGQWIKTEKNIGRIVARNSAANVFESIDEFADNPHVQSMSNRGTGYAVQWVQLNYEFPVTPTDKPIGYTPRRLCWLCADTIAEKRYQPCENPIAPKIEVDTDIQVAKQGETNNYQADAKLIAHDNSESIMRAMVEAGRRAEDWLRAYGFMP